MVPEADVDRPGQAFSCTASFCAHVHAHGWAVVRAVLRSIRRHAWPVNLKHTAILAEAGDERALTAGLFTWEIDPNGAEQVQDCVPAFATGKRVPQRDRSVMFHSQQ